SRFLADTNRAGTFSASPMIQYTRNVMNSVRPLDHAEEKIVILRGVELRTERAGFLHNVPPHCGQMTQIIVGEKQVGRPIWLKQRRLETVLAEFVFIGINQISVGMRLKMFHEVEKRFRFENVVMVEEGDPLPAGERESVVRRFGNAFV